MIYYPSATRTPWIRLCGGCRDTSADPADESFVYVGEPGMGEVVAQVVEVGPDPVGADGCVMA
jgi:hypothetical protein